MTSPGFYICVSSEVKTDVFDIWEYFLVYGLVQSSYSRSVLPLLAPVPPCLISDLFTQILLVVTFSRVRRSWLKRTIFRKSQEGKYKVGLFRPEWSQQVPEWKRNWYLWLGWDTSLEFSFRSDYYNLLIQPLFLATRVFHQIVGFRVRVSSNNYDHDEGNEKIKRK